MSMELKTDAEKTSYALGMDIGMSFRRLPVPVAPDAVIAGFTDVFGGKKPLLDQKEFVSVMQAFQAVMRDAAKQQAANLSAENRKQEAEFLEKNKSAGGIQVTSSGLQYKVLKEGSGNKPSKESVVKVHYTGTLPDGTVFDSSVQRGEPATFPVNGVIAGWTEALQLMTTGSKYMLYIPSKLAYGSRGAGQMIGPDQMLIFEVELLEIVS